MMKHFLNKWYMKIKLTFMMVRLDDIVLLVNCDIVISSMHYGIHLGMFYPIFRCLYAGSDVGSWPNYVNKPVCGNLYLGLVNLHTMGTFGAFIEVNGLISSIVFRNTFYSRYNLLFFQYHSQEISSYV